SEFAARQNRTFQTQSESQRALTSSLAKRNIFSLSEHSSETK
ncbi:hypothetical protein A2U01_0069944, partial [Trifolium medium]|nr:hypothetical protein [Trifolium medium]